MRYHLVLYKLASAKTFFSTLLIIVRLQQEASNSDGRLSHSFSIIKNLCFGTVHKVISKNTAERSRLSLLTRWVAWRWQHVKCHRLHSSALCLPFSSLLSFITILPEAKYTYFYRMFHWSHMGHENTLMSKNQSARRGQMHFSTPWWFL